MLWTSIPNAAWLFACVKAIPWLPFYRERRCSFSNTANVGICFGRIRSTTFSVPTSRRYEDEGIACWTRKVSENSSHFTWVKQSAADSWRVHSGYLPLGWSRCGYLRRGSSPQAARIQSSDCARGCHLWLFLYLRSGWRWFHWSTWWPGGQVCPTAPWTANSGQNIRRSCCSASRDNRHIACRRIM